MTDANRIAELEEWRPVKGYEGHHEVSDRGRIRRVGGEMLNPSLHHEGYYRVCLRVHGKKRDFSVHRLVLIAFRGDQPPKHEASHLNGCRTDNRLENLQWETSSQNKLRRRQHGTDHGGERNPNSKLTNHQVLEIRRRRKNGETYSSIAKDYGVTFTNVASITKHKSWQHALGGEGEG